MIQYATIGGCMATSLDFKRSPKQKAGQRHGRRRSSRAGRCSRWSDWIDLTGCLVSGIWLTSDVWNCVNHIHRLYRFMEDLFGWRSTLLRAEFLMSTSTHLERPQFCGMNQGTAWDDRRIEWRSGSQSLDLKGSALRKLWEIFHSLRFDTMFRENRPF